jgi:large exoprotein involved in heme utilization and adhesion
MTGFRSSRWNQFLGVAITITHIFSANYALAQITGDRTLPNNSNVTKDGNTLMNQAKISADTKGGTGNITLRSHDLILGNNSSITTNATGSNIIGGNINIYTDVLAAFVNSDISANCDQ